MDIQNLPLFIFCAVVWGFGQGRHVQGGYQTSRNRNSIVYPKEEEVKCVTDLGWPGRCVDVRVCRGAMRIIAAGNHPIRCGWSNEFAPKVCCHPDQVARRQQPGIIVYPDSRLNAVDTEQQRRGSSGRPSFSGNSDRRPFSGNSGRRGAVTT